MFSLQQVRDCIVQYANKSLFMAIVSQYYPPDDPRFECIEKVYNVVKEVSRGNNERHFEYLSAVALMLIVDLRIRDTDTIVAVLLSDIIDAIDNINGWTYDYACAVYGKEVATILWGLIKSSIDTEEFLVSNRVWDRHFHTKLLHAPPGILWLSMQTASIACSHSEQSVKKKYSKKMQGEIFITRAVRKRLYPQSGARKGSPWELKNDT